VEAIEGRERLGGVADEAEVVLGVVGDRELVVVARAQEAVAAPAVELRAPARPRVVRVGMAAALPVGRQAPGGERLPARVGELEPRLPPVGTRQPPR
jgi:hypothetical protein